MDSNLVKALISGDFQMDYISFGNGKQPMIILPGVSLLPITLSAPAIVSAYSPQFAKDYTVYLFVGVDPVPSGYSVDDLTDDIARAMAILEISKADVFGVSLGGMIAQRLAIRYPDRVRKMVIGSSIARQNAITKSVFDRFYALATAGKTRELNHFFWEKVYSPGTLQQFGDALKAIENEGGAEDLIRFARLIDAARRFDTWAELKKIACPTLVIGATEDQAVTAEASAELAKEIGCECYLYSDYGHAVYDEASDYKERLDRFFKAETRRKTK